MIKEEKEIDTKKEERIPAKKELDEMFEDVERIPKEVLSSELGLILFKEKSRENREYKEQIAILKNENKELEKKVCVYEERLSWKNLISIISAILLGASFFLIQKGTLLEISLILIGVVFIINLIKLGPYRFFAKLFKEGEKI